MAQDTLYMQLVNEWTALIQRGVLRPGEKMPSVRKACAQYQVSPATILAAYRLMEERGLVEARPQSGFYVRTQTRLPLPHMRRQSGTVATGDEVLDNIELVLAAQQQPGYLDLSMASPRGGDFYPTTRLKHILHKLSREQPTLATDYSYPPGAQSLREQVARRALAWGVALAADDIVTTNGCTEALQLALRTVCKHGDTIGLESPTYFLLLPLLKSLGLNVIEIPTHPTTGLSLDALELLLEEKRLQAIVAMPTVHNPLGATMPPENKKRLAALVNAHRVPLIEDCPHADLFYGQLTPDAVKAHDSDGYVLLCGSFNKTLAPGFRVGWIAPGRYRRELTRLKFASSLSQPRLLEETLAVYLQDGAYDQHLRFLRRHYQAQMARLQDVVAQVFPAGTRATSPTGGCLLWVELPGEADALQLSRAAYAEKMLVVPGALYSPRGRYRNCIRLSCCYPWSDAYQRGLHRLAELCDQTVAR
ncbi:PLP-dependent aminotransferase family protein [Vogesella urethralis]|uniref:aminotransferase-like domain-containing protein n=1 Tax=Vogesella urethralis TaxID=2592656 RepID=UPI0011867697|nr:PLP-dependent aminotransferase family protein [Vogesella urethralis]